VKSGCVNLHLGVDRRKLTEEKNMVSEEL